ncbi:putative cytochrome P450 [Durotheca rogersii]|uniref:putative cytochrome P450 n=1 Tax=Durotheca rogersii TaxID=419775 RepID=UPI00221F0822|nr:putative cytochrome P450 [Durotheca rogersii]KAI5866717.1 putative cytochrome P450 [Durotheca rogersii]
MLSELLLHPALLVVAIFILYSTASFLRRPCLPEIPIIGSRKGDWFPLLQAQWRNTRDFKAALEQAHAYGRPVLVPVAGEGHIVILPAEETKFITDQPDSVLGFSERAFEFFQVDYTFIDPVIPRVPLHEGLLRAKLTPQIGSLVPDLAEEVAWAFETHWGGAGTDEKWREVCVFETMRHIVGGVANRAFVGLPFCRDPELVNNGMAFAIDIPLSSTIIKLVWKPLRPLVAPLATIPNRIHTWRFRKILISEIDRRLRNYDKHQSGPEASEPPTEREPNDFLQWSIEQAKARGDPYMWRSKTLADRILAVNFATIHTTSFTLTEAVLDLVSSKAEYIDEIRDEITSVLAAHGGRWNKHALGQLKKLDSAIRESARFSSIVSIGLGRAVVAEGGLTTPSGVHLPRGTKVSVPAYCIMRDEGLYVGAETFMPFRFSDQRNSDRRVEGGDNNRKADNVRRARDALPTTSSDFLVFGHGRHACPGRFFAAAELKLILAHAFVNYDFEILPKKPEGSWVGVTRLPPLKATIRVKRRKK